MSSPGKRRQPEELLAEDQQREVEALRRYQNAVDQNQTDMRAQLRREYPGYLELFATIDELSEFALHGPPTTPVSEEPTRAFNQSARLSDLSHGLSAPLEFGRYVLLKQIGRGGMGAVFHARHTELNRDVAIKIVLSGCLATPEESARLLQEARSAAKLRHPSIVAIHDVGCHEGLHYLAMDFLPGGSLAARLEGAPMTAKAAATLTRQIALAVAYLHGRGVVHRDIKPSNIVYDEQDQPCLTDFGLAKVEEDHGMTRTGDVLGTASYMSPEQARGDTAAVGPAADVYSLGAVLYELLSGEPPFSGGSFLETILRVLEREPTPPHRLRAGVDSDLEQIALRCLQKDPLDRYATAKDLADDLSAYLRGEPIATPPASIGQVVRRTIRRYPALLAHLAVVAAVALIVAVRNAVAVGANPNYAWIQSLLVGWAAASLWLSRSGMRERRYSWPQLIWAAIDPLLITALIYLAEPPRAPLVVAYPAFVAASGLWARPALVYVATATSLAGYAFILLLLPEMFQPLHHVLIVVAVIVCVGLSVGHQVERLRTLSRYL